MGNQQRPRVKSLAVAVQVVCWAVLLTAAGADDSAGPRNDAAQRLAEQLANFRVEGTESARRTVGGEIWEQEVRIAAARAGDTECVRFAQSLLILSIRHPLWNDGGKQLEWREEFRDGNRARTSQIFLTQPACWPFCKTEETASTIFDYIPGPADFSHRSCWGDTLFNECINQMDFFTGFTAADLLGVTAHSPFQSTDARISPEQIELTLNSAEFGRVHAILVHGDQGWEVKRLTRIAEADQAIGRTPSGECITVKQNPHYQFGSQTGLTHYEVSYAFDVTADSLAIMKWTQHRSGARRFVEERAFRSRSVRFGKETPASVTTYATPLPARRKVWAYEPDRQHLRLIVRNGQVVEDHGVPSSAAP